MQAREFQQLHRQVMEHRYLQQETYQIDDVRYVLEKGNAASTERWTLWMYEESRFADVIAGDSVEEVFDKAAEQGVPVEKLTLDKWHD